MQNLPFPQKDPQQHFIANSIFQFQVKLKQQLQFFPSTHCFYTPQETFSQNKKKIQRPINQQSLNIQLQIIFRYILFLFILFLALQFLMLFLIFIFLEGPSIMQQVSDRYHIRMPLTNLLELRLKCFFLQDLFLHIFQQYICRLQKTLLIYIHHQLDKGDQVKVILILVCLFQTIIHLLYMKLHSIIYLQLRRFDELLALFHDLSNSLIQVFHSYLLQYIIILTSIANIQSGQLLYQMAVPKLNQNNKIGQSTNIVKRIYAYKPFRLVFKFCISLFAVKACGDLFFAFLTGDGWHLSRKHLVKGYGNQLNPPVYKPYPYSRTAKHIENLRNQKIYQNKVMQIYGAEFRNSQMYTNHPWRQNKDQIDHFLIYSNVHRVFEPIYYRVLQKMKNSGAQIPQGLSQKIRELDQYKLDYDALIKPEL